MSDHTGPKQGWKIRSRGIDKHRRQGRGRGRGRGRGGGRQGDVKGGRSGALHPRNSFGVRPPNYAELVKRYEKLQGHLVEEPGRGLRPDWSSEDALRAVVEVMFEDYYGLHVQLPPNHLVPTLTLRENYIRWIEDLLEVPLDGLTKVETKGEGVRGVDVGTGASAVFPLIGSSLNGWSWIGTEVDSDSADLARSSISRNGLDEKITVMTVDRDAGILSVLEGEQCNVDFVMMNPPFFAELEEQRVNEATAAPATVSELVTHGGEVEYVRGMIEASLRIGKRVRWYTSMLGKKASFTPLKESLRQAGITNIRTTVFAQGNTWRWGIGWTLYEPFKTEHVLPVHAPATPALALDMALQVANRVPGYEGLDDSGVAGSAAGGSDVKIRFGSWIGRVIRGPGPAVTLSLFRGAGTPGSVVGYQTWVSLARSSIIE